ncbi:MAG: MFS transporter [Clostridia bacterium]|nr:MFS transporter [Clostridia bacterium]
MLKNNRNFSLYITGLAISLFGTFTYNFAIGLYVLALTKSAQSFATTLIVGILPVVLLSPISGTLVDRYSKKHLLVIADTLSGILFLLLFLLFKMHHMTLSVIYLTTFIISILSTCFDNAMLSAKTLLFEAKDYERVNATSQVIRSVAIISAPLTGGLIYGFVDIGTFVLINGLSFLLSALIETQLKFPEVDVKVSSKTLNIGDNLKEGLAYLRSKPQIKGYILYFLVLNFILGFSVTVPVPYIINTLLQKPPEVYGAIEATFPIGLIIGGVTITKLSKKYSFERILLHILKVIAVLLILIGLTAHLKGLQNDNILLVLYFGIIHLFFGMAISYVDIPIITLLQRNVDQAYLGRVMGIIMSLIKSVYPVGLALSGFFCNIISPYVLPIIGASIALLLNVYMMNFSMMPDSLAEIR